MPEKEIKISLSNYDVVVQQLKDLERRVADVEKTFGKGIKMGAESASGDIDKLNISIGNYREAIRTAIEFELRVKGVYQDAVLEVTDKKGKHVLEILAQEEQGHLDYLNSRLKEWQETGKVTAETLSTALPSKDVIIDKIDEITEKMKPDESKHHSSEVKVLQRALEAERETSDFYRRMVHELSEEGHELFARFVEIEEGHLAMVQAELDYVSGPGYWFDFREFDLSGG